MWWFQAELWYALAVTALVCICIVLTVDPGSTQASRRARNVAMLRAAALAFLATLAAARFLLHPAPEDPLKHVLRTPADF